MPRYFSFALGNIWRWEKAKNKNSLLKYARSLDISGVELTIETREKLYATKLSQKNISWLRSLKYVSIHAPFFLVKDSESQEDLAKQLDAIAKLYKKVGAKNVIIHPDNLPAPGILEKYEFNVSTENLPSRSNYKSSWLENIFRKYKNIKFCLDASHAYTWSKRETEYLVKKYEPKISQIHFSGTIRKKPHQSFQKVSKDFFKSIKPLRNLDVPIVIEGDIKKKDIAFLKKEVEYIKKYFNG